MIKFVKDKYSNIHDIFNALENAKKNIDNIKFMQELSDKFKYNFVTKTVVSYEGSCAHVHIPDGTKAIRQFAFNRRNDVVQVIIPDSVTHIDEYAFFDCYELFDVTLGNGITRIERSTFGNCYELTEITIPDSVTYIGEYAFAGCENLKTVHMSENIEFISDDAFKGTLYRRSRQYRKLVDKGIVKSIYEKYKD